MICSSFVVSQAAVASSDAEAGRGSAKHCLNRSIQEFFA